MSEQEPTPAGSEAQGKSLMVRVDDRKMQRSYANAYRTHTTPEDVMVDFGLNMIVPAIDKEGKASETEGHVLFEVDHRIVMNYFTAKRLAITLGQIVRLHEDQFGELQLDHGERGGGDGGDGESS